MIIGYFCPSLDCRVLLTPQSDDRVPVHRAAKSVLNQICVASYQPYSPRLLEITYDEDEIIPETQAWIREAPERSSDIAEIFWQNKWAPIRLNKLFLPHDLVKPALIDGYVQPQALLLRVCLALGIPRQKCLDRHMEGSHGLAELVYEWLEENFPNFGVEVTEDWYEVDDEDAFVED